MVVSGEEGQGKCVKKMCLRQLRPQEMLARMPRERISFASLVGMQTGADPLENSVEVPQKVTNRTTPQFSNCTTRYLPKGCKNTDLKGYMHPCVYRSIANRSQIMRRAQMFIDLING